jgi:methanogenic corrinoid protein MtbC1
MNSVNLEASQVLRKRSTELARFIAAAHYGIQPDTWEKFGIPGHEKSIRDVGFHLAYLADAVRFDVPELFVDYVGWAHALFNGMNFPTDTVEKTLLSTRLVLKTTLKPAEMEVVDRFLQAGLDKLAEGPGPSPVFFREDLPMAGLARDYLAALLRGDRHAATEMILAASDRGVSLSDIYLNVFQRVQHEVGSLWQNGEINVAQEHFCSFVIELNMSALSPRFVTSRRVNRRVVAACIGDESHEIGLRMVVDFFEMGGWDTFFVGARTPAESVLQSLVKNRADVLAISVTLTGHLGEAASLIRLVHESEFAKNVRIIVGGYPFNVTENLWKNVGADGYGRDANDALRVANSLVGLTN